MHHWTSRVLQHIDDPQSMGKWTGFQFRFIDGKTLSIITAYCIRKQSSTVIDKSIQAAYKQQKFMLTAQHTESNNPMKMFIQDMTKMVNPYSVKAKNPNWDTYFWQCVVP
jgi:phage/plasmid primase-like uncharacterized protein